MDRHTDVPDGTFVQQMDAVLSSRRATAIEVGGRNWLVDGTGRHTEIVPRLPQAIGFATLTAIAEFAAKEKVGDRGGFFVVGSGIVKLFEALDTSAQRPSPAEAVNGLTPMLAGIVPGAWRGTLKEAIRGILTEFEESESRDALLKVLGNVDEESVRTHADDGISTSVTIRQGITRKAEATIKPLVDLESRLLLFPDMRKSFDPMPLRVAISLEGTQEKGAGEVNVTLRMADPDLDARLLSLNGEFLADHTDLPVLR